MVRTTASITCRRDDESDRPATGKFKFGPRECDIRWSSYILPDLPRLERLVSALLCRPESTTSLTCRKTRRQTPGRLSRIRRSSSNTYDGTHRRTRLRRSNLSRSRIGSLHRPATSAYGAIEPSDCLARPLPGYPAGTRIRQPPRRSSLSCGKLFHRPMGMVRESSSRASGSSDVSIEIMPKSVLISCSFAPACFNLRIRRAESAYLHLFSGRK